MSGWKVTAVYPDGEKREIFVADYAGAKLTREELLSESAGQGYKKQPKVTLERSLA